MTNNKQQTAVEWLIQELSKRDIDALVRELYKQAKEMEKKQIIDAFNEGQEYEYQYHINSTPKFDAETWYNETYGGNK